MAPKRKSILERVGTLSVAESKHTRFDDDSSDEAPVKKKSSTKHDASLYAPDTPKNLRAKATGAVGRTKEAYVLDLAVNSSQDTLGVGTDNGLKTYDVGSSSLIGHTEQSNLEGAVTAVKFSQDTSHCVFACGASGHVACWDTRQKRESQRFSAGPRYLNCLDMSKHMLAVGTNGSVLFWDTRKASGNSGDQTPCLAEFSDTHEEEVTEVRFHGAEEVFVSGSTDGLISVFDTKNHLDEDEGFQAALNLMDSVAAFDFCGANREQIWCQTFTENLYLWDWKAACSEDQEGGEGPCGAMKDSREQMASLMPSQAPEGFEYLVGCHYDVLSSQLQVLAGTKDGAGAVFPVSVHNEMCKLQAPCFSLPAAHSSVIFASDC